MTKRIKGWEQTLAGVTRAAMRKPHAWGLHDCALFAADCVAAITGEDFAADLRGTYETEDDARRVLAEMGCLDVGDLASRYLPEIDVPEARRGDVVMMEGEYGPFLAIVDGISAVGPAARGLTHTPMTSALRAWRVG